MISLESLPIPPIPRLPLVGDPLRRIRVPRDLTTVSARSDEAADVEALGMTPAGIERIWALVERLYRSGFYPAIALCVRREGQVVLDRAIGHARGNGPADRKDAVRTPATPETPFVIFSASKVMTTVVAHLLEERGLLHVDDRVVGEQLPGARAGLGRAQHLQHERPVAEAVEIEGVGRQVGHPRAVAEQLLDRDGLLAVDGVLGDVLAHAVVDVQQPALLEQVGHDGGHHLGCREDHKRRLRRGQRARRVLAVRRPIAACMANGAVEHDLTVAAHAQRDRGIEAAAVEALHQRPDALDADGRHAERLDVGRLVRTRADRSEVAGHPDSSQRVGHQR